MYDNSLGRWFNTDPVAEGYASYSPYNYCLGNPVNLVDPNGAWVTNGQGGLTTSNPGEIANFIHALQGESWLRSSWDGFGDWAWGFAMADTKGLPLYHSDGTRFLSPVIVTGTLSDYHVTLESMTRYTRELGAAMGYRGDYFAELHRSGYFYGNDLLSRADQQVLFNRSIHQAQANFINHPVTQISIGIMTSFIPVNGIGYVGKFVSGSAKTTKGLNFAQRLFLSEHFGITSRMFGSSSAYAKGMLNQGNRFFKMGWSTTQNGAMQWGYKLRIGIGSKGNIAKYHFYIPRSFVTNEFGNSVIQVKRSIYKLMQN